MWGYIRISSLIIFRRSANPAGDDGRTYFLPWNWGIILALVAISSVMKVNYYPTSRQPPEETLKLEKDH
jgi:hypothetical protein